MIDVHAHLFFDELLEGAGSLGPRIEQVVPGRHDIVVGSYRWPIGARSSLAETPTERIDSLDADGIDHQVLSLSPLWMLTHTEVEVSGPFLRRANTLLSQWCGARPDRLSGWAALPTQDVSAAIAELEHGVRDLGLVGGYIGTDARTGLDHPDMDDLYQACTDLDVPLFVHSTVPGVDGPAGDPRLDRFDGHVVLGYPHEETLAVVSLLFGTVLLRHPGLDVYVSHGGGSTAFQHGRLRTFAALPRSPITVEQFDAQFSRLWFDTHVNSPEALGLLRSVADPGRLVFGTNYRGWDSGGVEEVADFADDVVDNARTLLRRPVPAATASRAP